MKNVIKLFGIIALTAVIGFSFAACEQPVGENVVNQTPIAGDYEFGNLSQTAGSVTAVTITAKSGKSPGTVRNVQYNGNTNIPQTDGMYAVTFDVAAASGWNEAIGLFAGSLTVNPAAGGGNIVLTGIITITPDTDVTTGTELTANYTGPETVAYQWKKDGTNTGANSNKFTPSEAGSYTVTVSAEGYISKTSSAVNVTGATLTNLTGTITISPDTDVTIGMELTANYTGPETVTYQWKKDGINVGTNFNKFTPGEAGSYTVTVSAEGYNSKTSSAVNVETMPATSGLEFTLINNGTEYSVSRGTATDAIIIIPASYNGLPVTQIATTWSEETYSYIGGFAFYTDMTSIIIPSSVTSIGNYAFLGCEGLTSITIPEGVTSISDSAFQGCSGLTSITIPSSVTIIGGYAFRDCSGLTSITIPSSVTSIGYYAFYNCSGLTSITVKSGNTAYRSEGNCLIQISNNSLILGCKNSVIPTSVTSIGDYAFAYCSGLTSITIPSSVTSIGDYAFFGCSGLTSITIPTSVTSIGNWAFLNCSGLTSITVESGNTVYRSEGNCLIQISNNSLILGCKNSIIPEGVTSIGGGAFSYCSGLTSVTIPSSVTSIGYGAFQGCSGLTSVTIPEGVTDIGNGAFRDCSGLTSITIPSSVTSIGYGAFRDCISLTSITIQTGVTSIGGGAFSYCSGLTSVTIPSSVTSIGYEAFSDCSGLTTVFYGGSDSAAWSGISIGFDNTYLRNATRYYYSETHPGTANTHWRWVDGVETVWD